MSDDDYDFTSAGGNYFQHGRGPKPSALPTIDWQARANKAEASLREAVEGLRYVDAIAVTSVGPGYTAIQSHAPSTAPCSQPARERVMPEIRWEIDPEFRRAVAAQLAGWDFRQGNRWNVCDTNFLRREGRFRDEVADPSVAPAADVIKLKVEVEVKTAGGRTWREFVVQPATVNDRKRIADWVEKRKTSRAWLREDLK